MEMEQRGVDLTFSSEDSNRSTATREAKASELFSTSWSSANETYTADTALFFALFVFLAASKI